MSQWGKHARSFTADDGEYMIVIVHVAGPMWAPLADDHLIDEVLLVHGNSYFVNAKLIELKHEWVGKTYREWRESGPAAMCPNLFNDGLWLCDSSSGTRVWRRLDKPDKDKVDSS